MGKLIEKASLASHKISPRRAPGDLGNRVLSHILFRFSLNPEYTSYEERAIAQRGDPHGPRHNIKNTVGAELDKVEEKVEHGLDKAKEA